MGLCNFKFSFKILYMTPNITTIQQSKNFHFIFN